MNRRRNALRWVIPRRVTKKDDIFEGVGLKEIGLIIGMIVLGFVMGNVFKLFISTSGIMSNLVGVGFPAGFGLAMYALIRPSFQFNESFLTIYKRKKEYKRRTNTFFYQRRH